MNKTENKTPRITKAMRFTDIKALLSGDPVVHGTTVEDAQAFIDNELALLAKKNNAGAEGKKPTPTQIENEEFCAQILEYLGTLAEDDPGKTCTEILKAIPAIYDKGYGNQKVSALMRAMGPKGTGKYAGRVKSQEVKGKSLFSLA